MAITPWLHYADHPLALTCRSPPGSNMPVGDSTHIRELEQLEYLKARSGAWGKEYQYELVTDSTEATASGLTLTDPDTLREPAT